MSEKQLLLSEERVERLMEAIIETDISRECASHLYRQNDFTLIGTTMGLLAGFYGSQLKSVGGALGKVFTFGVSAYGALFGFKMSAWWFQLRLHNYNSDLYRNLRKLNANVELARTFSKDSSSNVLLDSFSDIVGKMRLIPSSADRSTFRIKFSNNE